MQYQEIRDSLSTGDIVLFSGEGGVSDWIKRFTRSRWSHVGLILRADELDLVLLWESTTLSTLADVDDQQHHRGVQTVDLARRLAGYEGEVAVRRLRGPRTSPQLAALAALRHELKNRPYEEHILDLCRAEIGDPDHDDLSSLFCSEMVAAAYRAMGLLPRTAVCGSFTPRDFSTEKAHDEDGVDRQLPGGYRLDAEAVITR